MNEVSVSMNECWRAALMFHYVLQPIWLVNKYVVYRLWDCSSSSANALVEVSSSADDRQQAQLASLTIEHRSTPSSKLLHDLSFFESRLWLLLQNATAQLNHDWAQQKHLLRLGGLHVVD